MGKIFVFTGTLEKFNRKKAKEIVESHGGRTSSAISKKTDYLVAGPGSGSKKDKAKTLGIDIINENEFEKLISKA